MDLFDALFANLHRAAIFVALQTGLHTLAIPHHFLTFWFIGKIPIVNIFVFMTAHARLAFVGRLGHI